jgi:hypothetical protein
LPVLIITHDFSFAISKITRIGGECLRRREEGKTDGGYTGKLLKGKAVKQLTG